MFGRQTGVHLLSDIRLTPLWKLAALRNILFVRVDVCDKSNDFEETRSICLRMLHLSGCWALLVFSNISS